MGRVCITVNLLIDQIIILYLLLHEIICLSDDENFLVGMHFVTYLLAHSLSICNSDISLKFHFTDLAPCRPSRAAGPSNLISQGPFKKNIEILRKLIYIVSKY